jgi:acyl transferase domain-containing protein
LLSNGITETTRAATAERRASVVVPSLRRNAPERQALKEALGQLFVAGHRIDWSLHHEAGELSVPLPSYPFERRRHWKSQPVMESMPQERTSGEYLIEPARRRASSDEGTSSRAQLQGSHGEARSTLLRHIVRMELAALVRCEPTRIEPHVTLQDLGIDSLMGLQLRSRLETCTGVVLSSTRMWEKPTPEGLCEQIAMAI